MHRQGFTLIELTFVVAIFTVVAGVLFTMSLSFADSIDVQNMKANSNDAARQVVMNLVPEVRAASRTSINWSQLPGDTLTFRTPADLDGNGTAVNQTGKIELGPVVTLSPDKTDANGDGVEATQLVRTSGRNVEVLVSGLAASATISSGDLVTQVNGVWFEAWGNGVRASLTTEGIDRRGRAYRSTFSQIIMPRN